jgi:hypothetical protein
MSTGRTAALVVRRALGSARDVARAHDALRAAGVPVGAALAAALGDDRWGVVLLAERRAAVAGALVLRWLRAVGDGPEAPPTTAWVERCWSADDDPAVAEALVDAARAEAAGRGVETLAGLTVEGIPPVPAADRPAAVDAAAEGALVTLAEGATARVVAPSAATAMATLWSGAQAFRARWGSDRATLAWSVDGCVGSRETDDGDALRFDAATRRLRELWLTRPGRVAFDEAAWRAAMALPATTASLALAEGDGFALPAMDVGVFDLGLTGYVALRSEAFAAGADALARWTAAAVSAEVALLFDEGGRCGGWRVLDPVARVRPMGWPDVRESPLGYGPARDALTALLYDWMCIDAGARVRPDLATDPDDIAHMVALRDRARSLAESARLAGDEAVAGVAADVAAHVHWSWGFFRVGD